MTDGERLADWLKRQQGKQLSGTAQQVTSLDNGGRLEEVGPSARYQVGLTLGWGGQAAVAEVVPVAPSQVGKLRLVARVEFYPRKKREFRRRDQLLFVAHLSRTQQDRYPSLVRVVESFVIRVPAEEIPGRAQPQSNAEWLWVDVMEQCVPLKTGLKAHPNGYDPIEGIGLVTPLLRTVAMLHRKPESLIHRDIDEGNVLVAADGTLRLADWGISHQMSGKRGYTYTEPWTKPRTRPPELRVNLEGRIGPFTDAWQCGRLLGWVFSGGSPFLDEEAQDLEFNSPRLRGLHPEIRAVIEGLCHPEPAQRLKVNAAAHRLVKYRRIFERWQMREHMRQMSQSRRSKNRAVLRRRMTKLMPLFMTALMFSSTLIYSTAGLLLLRPDTAAGVESFLSKMFTFSAFLALFYLIAGLLGFHVVRLLLWVVGILMALSTFWTGTESWSSSEGTIWHFPWYEVLPTGPAPPGFLVGWLSAIIEDLNLARGWVWTVGWVWASVGLLLVTALAFLDTPRGLDKRWAD